MRTNRIDAIAKKHGINQADTWYIIGRHMANGASLIEAQKIAFETVAINRLMARNYGPKDQLAERAALLARANRAIKCGNKVRPRRRIKSQDSLQEVLTAKAYNLRLRW